MNEFPLLKATHRRVARPPLVPARSVLSKRAHVRVCVRMVCRNIVCVGALFIVSAERKWNRISEPATVAATVTQTRTCTRIRPLYRLCVHVCEYVVYGHIQKRQRIQLIKRENQTELRVCTGISFTKQLVCDVLLLLLAFPFASCCLAILVHKI